MTIDDAIKDSQASIEKDDLRVLLPIIARTKPKHIVEIGAWKGYSAILWIEALQPEQFITIEIDSKENLLPNPLPEGIGYQAWYNSDSHDPEVLDRKSV